MNKNENSPNENKVSRERRGSAPQLEAESSSCDAPKQTKPAPVGCTAWLGDGVAVRAKGVKRKGNKLVVDVESIIGPIEALSQFYDSVLPLPKRG